ncbi:MAG: response regulator, partial [Candidatus Hodarchaeales archaeon]
ASILLATDIKFNNHKYEKQVDFILPSWVWKRVFLSRILLVDDDEVFLDIAKRSLELEEPEFEFDVAISGKDALNKVTEGNFDAIVADYQMPDMDGLELLNLLWREQEFLPFIILTGQGHEGVAIQALNRGVDYYLTKDEDPQTLYVKLVQILHILIRHKQTERALRESEERFRQVAENALEIIWEVTTEGLFTYINPVVEKVLGFKPEDVVGKKHFYDLYHREDQEQARTTVFGLFEKKESFRKAKNRIRRKDGSTAWLLSSGVPILTMKGELKGYRGAAIDITKREHDE